MSQIFFSLKIIAYHFLKFSSGPSIASLTVTLFIIIKVIVKSCHLFILKREAL